MAIPVRGGSRIRIVAGIVIALIGLAAYALSQVVSQMMQLRYGRKDELESDHYGLTAMSSAGFDPSAMLGLMKVLAQASTGGQPEMLSSHPHPETRIEAIVKWLRETYPSGVPGKLNEGRRLGPASTIR